MISDKPEAHSPTSEALNVPHGKASDHKPCNRASRRIKAFLPVSICIIRSHPPKVSSCSLSRSAGSFGRVNLTFFISQLALLPTGLRNHPVVAQRSPPDLVTSQQRPLYSTKSSYSRRISALEQVSTPSATTTNLKEYIFTYHFHGALTSAKSGSP